MRLRGHRSKVVCLISPLHTNFTSQTDRIVAFFCAFTFILSNVIHLSAWHLAAKKPFPRLTFMRPWSVECPWQPWANRGLVNSPIGDNRKGTPLTLTACPYSTKPLSRDTYHYRLIDDPLSKGTVHIVNYERLTRSDPSPSAWRKGGLASIEVVLSWSEEPGPTLPRPLIIYGPRNTSTPSSVLTCLEHFPFPSSIVRRRRNTFHTFKQPLRPPSSSSAPDPPPRLLNAGPRHETP